MIEDDFTIDQNYDNYTNQCHTTWKHLYRRQANILVDRAAPEFLDAMKDLEIESEIIPNFEKLSDRLEKRTGWRIVAVPGLIPDDVFFYHLSNKCFPVTNWIRSPEKFEYIQEPDVFHDIYGHVPLLANPFFSNFLQLYGEKGLRANGKENLHYLARLYWYTVEFGLIQTPNGLRIYGSGIASSPGESVYCLESHIPNRIKFKLDRVMLTNYIINTYQSVYFVIDSYEQLFDEVNSKLSDLYPILKSKTDYVPDTMLLTDEFVDI